MNNKKPNKLLIFLLIAIALPCSSIIAVHIYAESEILYYMLIALVFIFVINPILIILSFSLIKKYPKLPQSVVCTTSLNFLCWIILLLPAANIHAMHQAKTEQKFLQSYEPIIENIYKYKQENKKFPDKIEQIKSKYKINSHLIYTKTNQNFILQLNKDTQTIYFYCSNKQSSKCNPKDNRFVSHKNVGQWVKLQEID